MFDKKETLLSMRKREILSLQGNQITDGLVYLKNMKSNKRREIPVNPDLHEFLKLFAKIDDFRFHDLWHTFASHFGMRGDDLKAPQRESGQTPPTSGRFLFGRKSTHRANPYYVFWELNSSEYIP